MRPDPRTLLRFLVPLTLVAAGCDDGDPTGPRPTDFALDLRNLVVGSAEESTFTPLFTLTATSEVVPDEIEDVAIVWPDGTTTTVAGATFGRFGDGFRTNVQDEEHPKPLVTGTYVVSIRLRTGSTVTFEHEEQITLLERPVDVTLVEEANEATLSWTSPRQPHDWAVALYGVIDRPGPDDDLVFVRERAGGTAEGGASLGTSVAFADDIAPGQPFVLTILMDNEDNSRSFTVRGVRPGG